jgi:PST family polysaccharide transporter
MATTIPCTDSADQTLPEVIGETPRTSRKKGTHREILKSSALVGGSSLINIGIGIIRTKAMAMLLGPAGFGLFGIYNSVANITQTLAGMGVNSSGVRQIAEAVSSGEEKRVARTAVVLRVVSIVLGCLGAAFLIVFSKQVSAITFGNRQNASQIALLSIAVFLMLVSAGQGALIQGTRRIADLARMNTFGAISATLFSIPLVYFFHERGVVPALIAVAMMTLLASWWYSRKIKIAAFDLNTSAMLQETGGLLKLGMAFMSSGLMTMGVAYVVRLTILRKIGFEATGLYQSAWTLGGLYVSFILQAMGADFYPRLTAAANNNDECNRLVNEQTEIGVLLAGPGVLATLTFAPLVLNIFYSAKFIEAVVILRWLSLGAVLQVVTWPMGFIVIAKARQKLFFLCEAAWAVVSLFLAWLCVTDFGLAGAGMAFFGSYVFHGLMMYVVARHLTDFRWSSENTRILLLYLPLISIIFASSYWLTSIPAFCVGAVAVVLSSIYSVWMLMSLVSADDNNFIGRLVGHLGPVVVKVRKMVRVQ